MTAPDLPLTLFGDTSPEAALSGLAEAEPASLTQGPRRVYLETFGCQMNELDSELVRGQLAALGYAFTRDAEQADIVLYNTCSVREQAENKALSRIGIMGRRKAEGREVVLGVIGCLAEREGPGLLKKYPQVDLLCGPGELDKLPMLIDNALRTGASLATEERSSRVALQGSTARRSRTLEAAGDSLELLDLARAFDPDRGGEDGDGGVGGRSAYVRITRGCNKFCSYCVVPRTRGPEIHRSPDAIVQECRALADRGVIEITLLGQTVNHYVYVHGAAVHASGQEWPQVGPGGQAFRDEQTLRGLGSGPGNGSGGDGTGSSSARSAGVARVTTFADLLHRIHEEIPAIERLRFVTSYPRDFGDDVLSVMAQSPRICRYLHAPVQSGSNAVLKRMNRGYTREVYLDFIERARRIMPDVCIAGDIIVGFCGETDAEYEETRTLLKTVRFKNNFIFKYSPRPGTTAFERMADDVSEEVKRFRNNDLLALQATISAEVHREWVGRTVPVFVERVSRERAVRGGRGGGGNGSGPGSRVELGWERPEPQIQMSGRTGGDLITVFDLPPGREPADLLGRIVGIHVNASGPLLLSGNLVDERHVSAM